MLLCFLDRIEDAYWNLKKSIRMEYAGKSCSNGSQSGAEDKPNNEAQGIRMSLEGQMRKSSEIHSLPEKRDLLNIVSFQQENFVRSQQHTSSECYDAILW